jgi:hypothetical protein
MNCDRCKLEYGPYAILPWGPSTKSGAGIDTDCPSVQMVSTEDANFYVCHKSGMPGKPTGWYPGRGY